VRRYIHANAVVVVVAVVIDGMIPFDFRDPHTSELKKKGFKVTLVRQDLPLCYSFIYFILGHPYPYNQTVTTHTQPQSSLIGWSC